MPHVTCPGCGRKIPLDESELGSRVECAVCGRAFGTRGPLPPTTLYTEPAAEPPPVYEPLPRRPMPVWLIAGGIVGAIVAAASLGTVLLSVGLAPQAVSTPAHQRPPENPQTPTTAADPYPECAAVRRWLEQHQGEVEIISWGKRSTIDRQSTRRSGGFEKIEDTYKRIAEASANPGTHFVLLNVRFRLKGGRELKMGIFVLGPGDAIESATVED